MADKQKTLIAEVHKSGLKVRLTVGREEMTLDAAEMDTLIRELGIRRAMLSDVVPHDLDPNANFNPVMQPQTHIGSTVVGEKEGQVNLVMMAIRHPGFGWQSMTYTKESARGIVQGLEKVLRTIDPLHAPQNKLILPPSTK